MEQHYRFSSYREKLIEHLFVGELLKASWLRGECSLEIAKPEVDSRGYDVIIERRGVVRHIQLKTSHREAAASGQKVHLGLAEKPSGCIVWIQFDEKTLSLGPFLFFGNAAGLPLADIRRFKIGKHAKANAEGIKAERPDIRVVPKSQFQLLSTIDEVFEMLFGPASVDQLLHLQEGLHNVIHGRLREFDLGAQVDLPLLGNILPTRDAPAWLAIPGMYGGFSYWGEEEEGVTRLMVESWSRVVQGSAQRHVVSELGVVLIDEGFV